MQQDLADKIETMELYKTFEPYIDPKYSLADRMKGDIALVDGAPKDAVNALTRWKAKKLAQM